MASLYNVKIRSIDVENKSITVNIEAIHPDAMYFSTNLGFAIRLIHDSATGNSAIAKKIDTASLFSKDWMKQNVKGFISGCELIEIKTSGNPEIKNNGSDSYWSDEEAKNASATLRIQFTNTAWFEHLSNNSMWKSTAYPADVDFIACPAVHPSSAGGLFSDDYDNSGGWELVNAETLPNYIISWPKNIHIPKYSEKSYNRINKLSGNDITSEIINSWLFKTVFVLRRNGFKTFGLLVPQKEQFGVLSINTTGHSSSFFEIQDILTIGLSEFDLSDSSKATVFEKQN